MASSVKNQSLKPFKNGGLFFILKDSHDNIKEMHFISPCYKFEILVYNEYFLITFVTLTNRPLHADGCEDINHLR